MFHHRDRNTARMLKFKSVIIMRWSILFFLCFNLSNGYSQIIESHPLSKDSKLVALPLSVNTPKEIDNLVKTDNLSKDINNKSNELTHNRDATDRNATMNGQKNNLQIIVTKLVAVKMTCLT